MTGRISTAAHPPSCDICDSSELAGDFGGCASSLLRHRVPRGGAASGGSGFGFSGGEELVGSVEGDRVSERVSERDRASKQR
jgi:hypothetical protein